MAIKILRPNHSPRSRSRFLQEAWVTGGMAHPGIVPVYELGQTPDGIPYYTMRFVKGNRTLASAIDEVRDRSAEEIRDIYYVRLDRDGAGSQWTAPAPVHEDGWVMPGCPVNGPRLAVNDDAVVVAWYTGAGGGAGRVLASFLEGDAFGEPIQVDEGAPIGRVDVVATGADQLLVAWLEHAGKSAQWRARYARRRGEVLDSHLLEAQ